MKKILLIIALILVEFSAVAQMQNDAKPLIAVIGRSHSTHIELRYFAANAAIFKSAIKLGYQVERANYRIGIPLAQQSFSPIKGSPFKRWNEMQWESAFKQTDTKDSTQMKLAAFAMAISDTNASVGKKDVLEGGLKSLKEERDNQDMNFAYSLIAANRSKLAAEGLALLISDADVIADAEYIYRVSINDPNGFDMNTAGYIKIKNSSFNQKYLVNNKAIKLVEDDKQIFISFPESKEYYAYNIERSDDLGVSFKKITNEPALKLKAHGYEGKSDYGFNDSGLVNYKKYFYRVLVSTPFADDLLLSEFSAIPRDKTPPPAPFLKSATHIKPNQVELVWEMPKDVGGDFKGFNIRRSVKIKGDYTLISKKTLSKDTKKYIDEGFEKNGTNYYLVESVDTAGNINQSFPAYVTLIDSTPPAAPVIDFARIDSLGKITIQVKPNKEKDFMGYQVLKANSKEHEFSIVEETFKDSLGATKFTLYDSTTLNTLTKNIFYKLIAFDTHFNQSEPSKIIELTKRDTIPPVSPLIAGFHITDSTVVIEFVNSSSEDAQLNMLLRRESGKEKFDTVYTNANTAASQYTDKSFIGGSQYEYMMIARDQGGLLSKPSNHIFIKTFLNNRLKAPILKGGYDYVSKKISLDFIVDEKQLKGKLVVELFKRSDVNAAWVSAKLIEFIKGKSYIETVPDATKSMIYCIRLIDSNNRVSNFSNELELKF